MGVRYVNLRRSYVRRSGKIGLNFSVSARPT
jgi:hypothetical protein